MTRSIEYLWLWAKIGPSVSARAFLVLSGLVCWSGCVFCRQIDAACNFYYLLPVALASKQTNKKKTIAFVPGIFEQCFAPRAGTGSTHRPRNPQYPVDPQPLSRQNWATTHVLWDLTMFDTPGVAVGTPAAPPWTIVPAGQVTHNKSRDI